jgi:predicted NUDIX family phosphoesterase
VSQVATERVLVVPTSAFQEAGYFQGFSTDVDRYLSALLKPSLTTYLARDLAENDPSFKQLIPYVIFRHTASDGRVSLFQYTRGKGQGEGRLHSKRSVGIGGHISDVDDNGQAKASHNVTYQEGMRRELDEEVIIETEYRESCVGLINDDETEVGRVHLGIVHVFDVDQPLVRPQAIRTTTLSGRL